MSEKLSIEHYHKHCSEQNLEDLLNEQEDLLKSFETFEGVFSKENHQKIKNVFTTKERIYNLDFKTARAFRQIKDKVLADGVFVTKIAEIRILQAILVGLKFETNEGADIVADFIEAINETNEVVFETEQKIQICSTYIQRKQQEKETNLKYSETDNEIISTLEVRPPEHFDEVVVDEVDPTVAVAKELVKED